MLHRLFSGCGKQWLLSTCIAMVPRCPGFSRCRAVSLGHMGSVVCGLQAPQHRLNTCGTETADPWHVGSPHFPDQESNPCPLHYEANSCRLPGKSCTSFKSHFLELCFEMMMDMYLKYQCMFWIHFWISISSKLPSPKQTYWSQAGKKKKKSVTLCRVTEISMQESNTEITKWPCLKTS